MNQIVNTRTNENVHNNNNETVTRREEAVTTDRRNVRSDGFENGRGDNSRIY